MGPPPPAWARPSGGAASRGTRKGCDHYGVPEKFDEHLARLWARAISGAAGDDSHSATFQEFIARSPHLRRGDLFGKR
jgi:hypothetical protein